MQKTLERPPIPSVPQLIPNNKKREATASTILHAPAMPNNDNPRIFADREVNSEFLILSNAVGLLHCTQLIDRGVKPKTCF